MDDDAETVAETLVSIITRCSVQVEGTTRVVAVKSAPASQEFAKEPHDIVKELRILSAISHPCIIEVWGYYLQKSASVMAFRMPYIPVTLAMLLSNPLFSPRPHHSLSEPFRTSAAASFLPVTRSLVFQMLSAVDYLHDPQRKIAHRDLKPTNMLIDASGVLKLIDFGIAYRELDGENDRARDVWPESRSEMYFQVGTGPYRAPELLFGPQKYDAIACDLWSIGTVVAEFFTTLHRRSTDEDYEEDYEEEEQNDPTQSYILDKEGPFSEPEWERYTVFNGSRGDIGLAWSIFKIRGTPTQDNWPSFKELPDATKVNFIQTPTVDLAALLPNAPEEPNATQGDAPSHFPDAQPSVKVSDLVHRFLVYPQPQRLSAKLALDHPWLASSPVLIPSYLQGLDGTKVTFEYEGMTSGDYMQAFMGP